MNPWEHMAQEWQRVKPPLRPVRQDLAFLERWIRQLHANSNNHGDGALRVLILGATPEYHSLPWPAHTRLLAVDYAQAMLDQLWPGPASTTLCADWLTLTSDLGRFDLVMGDGCLCQLRWPDEQSALANVISKLLQPGGLWLTRLFVREPLHENFDAALEDLMTAPVRTINIVKLRLWLATQPSASAGISARQCWQQLVARIDDPLQLAHLLNESLQATQHITAQYLQQDQRNFHFADMAALMQMFNANGLVLQDSFTPDYPLGAYCPSVALRAAAADRPGD